MKVVLAEEFSGVSRLYREEFMSAHYDPPGPTFDLNEDGRREADLRKDVAEQLIEEGIADPVEGSEETDDSDADADDSEDADTEDGAADDADDAGDGDGDGEE